MMSGSVGSGPEHSASSQRDCGEVLRQLYVFIDNELPEADRSEVQAHLDECRGCLSEVDIERLIKALVQKSCHEKAPAELRQRVLFSIRHIQWQISTGRLD
jgi:mycothiol system anti-sigma-R factor